MAVLHKTRMLPACTTSLGLTLCVPPADFSTFHYRVSFWALRTYVRLPILGITYAIFRIKLQLKFEVNSSDYLSYFLRFLDIVFKSAAKQLKMIKRHYSVLYSVLLCTIFIKKQHLTHLFSFNNNFSLCLV